MSEVPGSNPPLKYWAFISYSSLDRSVAQWLHRRLEGYSIPKEFRSIQFDDGTVLGPCLRPVFRDRDELSGSANLGPAISKALAQSRYLIVLCSPNSARSVWVNKEIEDFRAMKGSGSILALILAGVPNATSNPVLADELECFPPALRYPEEPLAGDLRKEGDGKERGFLKILSGVAQLDFDVLYRRHERAQRKKQITLATIATAVIVSLAGLSTFALRQKNEAQHQTIVANGREKEAAYERDQAKKTLARFYTERALAGDDPFKSLAWLVKACGIDPSVFSNSHISSRAADWIGPWPAPDLCLGTNIVAKSSLGMNSGLAAHSRMSGKSAIQTGPRSWNLIDWKSKCLVESFEFGELIESIEHRSDEDFFTVVGRSGFEIRSWSDGRMLFRHSEASSGLEISPVAGGIFFAVYDYNEKATQFGFVERENGDFIERKIGKLRGECDRIAGSVSPKSQSIFTIVEAGQGAPRSLRGFVRSTSRGRWSETVVDAAEFSPMYFADAPGLPTDRLLITQADKRPTLLFRPEDLSFIELTAPVHLTAFAQETGSDSPLTIVTRSLENGRGCEILRRSMKSGEERLLLSGPNLQGATLCQQSRSVAAWDDEKSELVWCSLDGETVTFPFHPPPHWPSFSVSDLSELSPQLLLINAYSGNRRIFFLADLSAKGENVFYFGSAPAFETCLDAVHSDSGYAATCLTHNGSSVSYFDNLLTIPKALVNQPSRIWQAPGEVGWLGITDDGKETALVTRNENDQRELALVFPECAKPSWHKSSWTGSPTMTSSESTSMLPQGGMAVISDGKIQQIDSNGNLVRNMESNFAVPIQSRDEHAILRQAEGDLSLTDISGKLTHWNIPFAGIIQGVNYSEQTDRILILSSDLSLALLGDPEKFTLSLSLVNPKDGARTAASFERSGEDTEVFSAYGSSFRLLPGKEPRVLVILGSKGGVSEGLILEPSGSELHETLRWQIDTSGISETCITLPDGSFITRELIPGEPVSRLSHYEKQQGEWKAKPLPISSSDQIIRIFPSMEGNACVILLENSGILYNLSDHSQIGGDLKMSGDDSMISSANDLLWAASGENFYLSGGNSIHEFSASTGLHLRQLNAHNRNGNENQRPELNHVTISPDGRWLSSSDSLGKIVTSLIWQTPPSLESLESKSNNLGGLRISKNDDIEAWLPPAFPPGRIK